MRLVGNLIPTKKRKEVRRAVSDGNTGPFRKKNPLNGESPEKDLIEKVLRKRGSRPQPPQTQQKEDQEKLDTQLITFNIERADRLEELLKQGANVNAEHRVLGTCLMMACRWNYEQTVELLLKYGADVNIKKGRNRNIANQDGFTALHYACARGSLEIIKILIKHGANVNAKSDQGKTCLDIARSSRRKDDVINELKRAGAR